MHAPHELGSRPAGSSGPLSAAEPGRGVRQGSRLQHSSSGADADPPSWRAPSADVAAAGAATSHFVLGPPRGAQQPHQHQQQEHASAGGRPPSAPSSPTTTQWATSTSSTTSATAAPSFTPPPPTTWCAPCGSRRAWGGGHRLLRFRWPLGKGTKSRIRPKSVSVLGRGTGRSPNDCQAHSQKCSADDCDLM